MEDQVVTESFESLISFFEKEVKTLKCIASMRGLTSENCPDSIKFQLSNINNTMDNIEKKATLLEQYIDNEIHACNELNKLSDMVTQQNTDVSELIENTPTCFKLKEVHDNIPEQEDTTENIIINNNKHPKLPVNGNHQVTHQETKPSRTMKVLKKGNHL